MKIPEQDNELFSFKYNKQLDCYDMSFKKASYHTTLQLMDTFCWLHQLGIQYPEVKLRIGAHFGDYKVKSIASGIDREMSNDNS